MKKHKIINYLGKDFYKKYQHKFIVEYPKLTINKNYLEKLISINSKKLN